MRRRHGVGGGQFWSAAAKRLFKDYRKRTAKQQWHWRRADKLSAAAARRSTKVISSGNHKLSAAAPRDRRSGRTALLPACFRLTQDQLTGEKFVLPTALHHAFNGLANFV